MKKKSRTPVQLTQKEKLLLGIAKTCVESQEYLECPEDDEFLEHWHDLISEHYPHAFPDESLSRKEWNKADDAYRKQYKQIWKDMYDLLRKLVRFIWIVFLGVRQRIII